MTIRTIADLLRAPPALHGPDGALTAAYRLEDAMFGYFEAALTPGMRTIEIGAGVSTIMFALKRTEHLCIVQEPKQIARIRAYCAAESIALDTVTFRCEPSQFALPTLRGQRYTFALIDGNHGFPAPFVDWYYVAGLLEIGGVAIVDDLHIWTCDVLAEFLAREAMWERVFGSSRTAVFRKLADGSQDREWERQPFVLAHSRASSRFAAFSYIGRMLSRREWRLLWENIRLRLGH